MKKKLLIPLAVFLLIFGVGAAVMLRPRAVPWDECSELYRRYADCPGVEAAYIKDYRVNDTLPLCATVLEAQTDSAWSELSIAYRLDYYIDSCDVRQALEKGNDILTLLPYLSTPPADSNDLAVVSSRDRYICVFHPSNKYQSKYPVSLKHWRIVSAICSSL